ncbi:hypothetical protein JOQ06_029431, partial [Pogonophryne albipinna]
NNSAPALSFGVRQASPQVPYFSALSMVLNRLLYLHTAMLTLAIHKRVALIAVFSFPGPRLQPLPSHSSTNSRRRTAKPAAERATYRFFFRTSQFVRPTTTS